MNPITPTTRQVMLGVFIVGQLLFLVTANLLNYARDNREELEPKGKKLANVIAPGWPEERGHFWNLSEHIIKTDKLWSQATGQFQTWSLFAPGIGRECVFPALELRWDDEPASAAAVGQALAPVAGWNALEAAVIGEAVRFQRRMHPDAEVVLSDNEPANLESYLRVGNFRMRRYENNLVIVLRPFDTETADETKERWRGKIRDHATDYSDILQGYLRWRTGKLMARWPDRPQPRQVILHLRRYHINDDAKAPPYWDGPSTSPLVRWQPAVRWDGDHQSLEWYDPVQERFRGLRR